jgi:hypothetical protein
VSPNRETRERENKSSHEHQQRASAYHIKLLIEVFARVKQLHVAEQINFKVENTAIDELELNFSGPDWHTWLILRKITHYTDF